MAMDIEYDDEIIKPEKWPANQRERRLQLKLIRFFFVKIA